MKGTYVSFCQDCVINASASCNPNVALEACSQTKWLQLARQRFSDHAPHKDRSFCSP